MNALKRIYLICLLSMGFIANTFAHALWIETSSTGQKNQTHSIKVYYGEYSAGELDPIDKWYSDVKEFELWLTTPSQKKIRLEKTAEKNFFSSSFLPQEEGQYYVSVVHAPKDLGGKTKYEFSSFVPVTIGKVAAAKVISGTDLPLSIQVISKVVKQNQPVEVQVLANGAVLADAEVIVMSQEGWSKAFKTNAEGKAVFPVLWKGNYVIEVSHGSQHGGEWRGAAYERTWQGSTTFVSVN